MIRESQLKTPVLLLTLIVVLALGIDTWIRAVVLPVPRTDFSVYTLAAQAVMNGDDIYRIQNVRGWNYVYPPLFSVLMIPFAALPLGLSVVLWYLLGVAALYYAVRMSVQMTGTDGLAFRYLPLLMMLDLTLTGLTRGQVSTHMVWLITAAIFCEWKGWPIRGAACLAGAVLLKVFPVMLLGYYIWRGKWRMTMAVLAFVFAGLFIVPSLVWGWHGNLDLLREWATIVAAPALKISARSDSPVFEQLLDPTKKRNQSFEAVFSRVLPDLNAMHLAIALGLIMAVVMLVVAMRRREKTLLVSAVMCWMLLISPVAEDHYFVLLVFPVTVVLTLHRSAIAKAGLLFFLACNSSYLLTNVPWTWREAPQLAGALCWGTLGLWATLIAIAWRGDDLKDPAVQFEYSK